MLMGFMDSVSLCEVGNVGPQAGTRLSGLTPVLAWTCSLYLLFLEKMTGWFSVSFAPFFLPYPLVREKWCQGEMSLPLTLCPMLALLQRDGFRLGRI